MHVSGSNVLRKLLLEHQTGSGTRLAVHTPKARDDGQLGLMSAAAEQQAS